MTAPHHRAGELGHFELLGARSDVVYERACRHLLTVLPVRREEAWTLKELGSRFEGSESTLKRALDDLVARARSPASSVSATRPRPKARRPSATGGRSSSSGRSWRPRSCRVGGQGTIHHWRVPMNSTARPPAPGQQPALRAGLPAGRAAVEGVVEATRLVPLEE